MVHPNNGFISSFVPAKFDSVTNEWKLVIDIGDPDTILPYSNKYDAELLIGD